MGVDAWSKLSMRDRSRYIKLALENGVSDLNEIRDTFNLYAEGGELGTNANTSKEEQTAPAMEVILRNRNSLDRKYDFIVDTWESEYNGKPKGYNAETGKYYPYKSPEQDVNDKGTVGPGLKVRPDGKGDAYSFTESEVRNGVTRQQIDEKLGNNAELQYAKVLEFLNQKGNRLPYDTISPSIMRGLMDLRYQLGSLGSYNKLREAVLKGNLKGIQAQGNVTYLNQQNQRVPDTRRNEYRKTQFWHFDDGGQLFSTGGPLYPFSFEKGNLPPVRY